MPPYPIALSIKGWPCLIVGGGNVAARKVRGLLEAGARVTVIAPQAVSFIGELGRSAQLVLLERPFETSDVEGIRLVFACTNNPDVNTAVVAAARERGILSNRSDDSQDCDFTGMSAVVRGELLVGIATGAGSPAFARWMRCQLETWIGPEYGELLELLAELRQKVTEQLPPAERQNRWRAAVESNALQQLQSGDRDGARQSVLAALGIDCVLDGPAAERAGNGE